MKKLISALISCIMLVGVFAIPVSADEADYSRYVGKWNWENSAPLLENLDNWYTYNEAWVDILSVNGSDITFKYYHQRGGTHLYIYDICAGSLSGNTVTAVTNARKEEDGLIFAQFRITMTLYDDYIYLEAYNLTEQGIAFEGKFNPGFAYQAPPRISVKINGQDVNFDVPPQIINDRTMVPMRAIFEALNATVKWDETTSTVTSDKDETTIVVTANSDVMYVNGNKVPLDTPAVIRGDRILVPVRAISESFGLQVKWNENEKTVYISDALYQFGRVVLMDDGKTAYTTDFAMNNGGVRFESGELDLKKITDFIPYTGEIYGFTIYRDKIYYLDGEAGSDSLPARICSCNFDGSNIKEIVNDACNYSTCVIYDGYVYYDAYYTAPNDYGYYALPKGKIYRISVDGADKMKLVDKSGAAQNARVFFEYMDRNNLFYSYGGKRYMCNLDGEGETEVPENDECFADSNDYTYAVDATSGTIYRLRKSSRNDVDDSMGGVYNSHVGFYTSDYLVFSRCGINGGMETEVARVREDRNAYLYEVSYDKICYAVYDHDETGNIAYLKVIDVPRKTNIDYSKYIGEYSRLGGSLGFHWTLNIKNITDAEVVFDFGYEKPNFTYTAEPAVFTDATHAVAHGKRIYEYEEMHTETDLTYYLEFTDDGINVNYRESDSNNAAVGTHFTLSADKI